LLIAEGTGAGSRVLAGPVPAWRPAHSAVFLSPVDLVELRAAAGRIREGRGPVVAAGVGAVHGVLAADGDERVLLVRAGVDVDRAAGLSREVDVRLHGDGAVAR